MLASLLSTIALAGAAVAAPVNTHTFAKRFGGEATYYATGLGACGGTNQDSDFIVALNAPQYGNGYPGPECGKQVSISYNGKTTTATIVDKCPGCAYGDLDMSPSLFEFFADKGVGRFQMSWEFVGGGGGGGGQPATTEEPPKPSPTPTPEPTPEVKPATSEQPSTESPTQAPSSEAASPSPAATSDTSSSAASSTDSSSSSVVSSSASNSSTSAPSSTLSSSQSSSSATNTAPVVANPDTQSETSGEAGNLGGLYSLISQLGRLTIVGASA